MNYFRATFQWQPLSKKYSSQAMSRYSTKIEVQTRDVFEKKGTYPQLYTVQNNGKTASCFN